MAFDQTAQGLHRLPGGVLCTGHHTLSRIANYFVTALRLPVELGVAACGGAPGGADARRAAQVYPHGSTDALPYATMGSGSLNAMAVFEQGFREGLGRDDAVALVARAIRSGIFNDLGSGSNVDVCVITRGKARARRSPAIPCPAVRGRRACMPLWACCCIGLMVGLMGRRRGGVQVDYMRNYEYLMDKTVARETPVVYPPGTARAPARRSAPCQNACACASGFELMLAMVPCLRPAVRAAAVLKERRWKTGDARVALAAEGERPEAMDVS